MTNLEQEIKTILDKVEGITSMNILIDRNPSNNYRLKLSKINKTDFFLCYYQLVFRSIRNETDIILESNPELVQETLFATNLKIKDMTQLDYAMRKIYALDWHDLNFNYEKET